MNKYIVCLAGITAALLMSACGNGPSAYEAEMNAKADHPKVTDQISVDGCDVKYYDRGYAWKSFYVAKCAGTTITTTTMASSGKIHYPKATIVEQKADLDRQLAELQTQRDALAKQEAVRHEAIAKLSPEERAALAITPQ